MRPEPPKAVVQAVAHIAELVGATSFTVTTPMVCDHCQDPSGEAFPYHVTGPDGRTWPHLCNECFDHLGFDVEDLDQSWQEGEPFDPFMFGYE